MSYNLVLYLLVNLSVYIYLHKLIHVIVYNPTKINVQIIVITHFLICPCSFLDLGLQEFDVSQDGSAAKSSQINGNFFFLISMYIFFFLKNETIL